MKAKEIKDILIAYLTANNSEIRIYSEKSIGSSICDLMAVTDKLTGFEIKSDSDNYARLHSQIEAYTKFFNENYIVVGEKHAHSASDKVPSDWGIILIKNDGVSILRKASENRGVNAKSQLSILWALELKNILIKSDMPVYAQKDKAFIASEIAEYLDGETITKLVADELMRRDYSIYDAADYTVCRIEKAAY